MNQDPQAAAVQVQMHEMGKQWLLLKCTCHQIQALLSNWHQVLLLLDFMTGVIGQIETMKEASGDSNTENMKTAMDSENNSQLWIQSYKEAQHMVQLLKTLLMEKQRDKDQFMTQWNQWIHQQELHYPWTRLLQHYYVHYDPLLVHPVELQRYTDLFVPFMEDMYRGVGMWMNYMQAANSTSSGSYSSTSVKLNELVALWRARLLTLMQSGIPHWAELEVACRHIPPPVLMDQVIQAMQYYDNSTSGLNMGMGKGGALNQLKSQKMPASLWAWNAPIPPNQEEEIEETLRAWNTMGGVQPTSSANASGSSMGGRQTRSGAAYSSGQGMHKDASLSPPPPGYRRVVRKRSAGALEDRDSGKRGDKDNVLVKRRVSGIPIMSARSSSSTVHSGSTADKTRSVQPRTSKTSSTTKKASSVSPSGKRSTTVSPASKKKSVGVSVSVSPSRRRVPEIRLANSRQASNTEKDKKPPSSPQWSVSVPALVSKSSSSGSGSGSPSVPGAVRASSRSAAAAATQSIGKLYTENPLRALKDRAVSMIPTASSHGTSGAVSVDARVSVVVSVDSPIRTSRPPSSMADSTKATSTAETTPSGDLHTTKKSKRPVGKSTAPSRAKPTVNVSTGKSSRGVSPVVALKTVASASPVMKGGLRLSTVSIPFKKASEPEAEKPKSAEEEQTVEAQESAPELVGIGAEIEPDAVNSAADGLFLAAAEEQVVQEQPQDTMASTPQLENVQPSADKEQVMQLTLESVEEPVVTESSAMEVIVTDYQPQEDATAEQENETVENPIEQALDSSLEEIEPEPAVESTTEMEMAETQEASVSFIEETVEEICPDVVPFEVTDEHGSLGATHDVFLDGDQGLEAPLVRDVSQVPEDMVTETMETSVMQEENEGDMSSVDDNHEGSVVEFQPYSTPYAPYVDGESSAAEDQEPEPDQELVAEGSTAVNPSLYQQTMEIHEPPVQALVDEVVDAVTEDPDAANYETANESLELSVDSREPETMEQTQVPAEMEQTQAPTEMEPMPSQTTASQSHDVSSGSLAPSSSMTESSSSSQITIAQPATVDDPANAPLTKPGMTKRRRRTGRRPTKSKIIVPDDMTATLVLTTEPAPSQENTEPAVVAHVDVEAADESLERLQQDLDAIQGCVDSMNAADGDHGQETTEAIAASIDAAVPALDLHDSMHTAPLETHPSPLYDPQQMGESVLLVSPEKEQQPVDSNIMSTTGGQSSGSGMDALKASVLSASFPIVGSITAKTTRRPRKRN